MGTIQLEGYLIVIIYIVVFSSLVTIKYLIDNSPMERTGLNRFAFFNEICLLFSFYFIFLFTDFITDVEFRYNFIGSAFIQYVSIIFGINFLLICYGMALDICISIKKKRYVNQWESYHEISEKMAKYLVFQAMRERPELVLMGEIRIKDVTVDIDFKVMEERIKDIHQNQVVPRDALMLKHMTKKRMNKYVKEQVYEFINRNKIQSELEEQL